MSYIPERGDLVWINFSPQIGHEQAGFRPALVISRALVNGPSNLMFVCPVTKQIKGYPFEVSFAGKQVSGAVLVDHLKSFDWRSRGVEYIEKIEETAYQEVEAKLKTLIL